MAALLSVARRALDLVIRARHRLGQRLFPGHAGPLPPALLKPRSSLRCRPGPISLSSRTQLRGVLRITASWAR